MSTVNNNYADEPYPGSPSSQSTGADTWNPDDYSFIPLAAAPDVEAIAKEAEDRDFRPLDVGDHLLFVKGFKGRPEDKHRTGFLRGVPVSWVSPMVTVWMTSVADPRASLPDTFDLPPANPRDQEAYLY